MEEKDILREAGIPENLINFFRDYQNYCGLIHGSWVGTVFFYLNKILSY